MNRATSFLADCCGLGRTQTYGGLVQSPPRRAVDTRTQHLVDRLLPTGVARCVLFVGIAVGLGVAASLPLRPGLLVGALVTLMASAYCLLNFWRCREAHCVVTGYGWAALGGLGMVEFAIGRSLIGGNEGLVFVAILAIGYAFEILWRVRRGTNAVTVTGGPAAALTTATLNAARQLRVSPHADREGASSGTDLDRE